MAIYANCTLGGAEIKMTHTPRLYVGRSYAELSPEQYEDLLIYFDYDDIGQILRIFKEAGGVILISR